MQTNLQDYLDFGGLAEHQPPLLNDRRTEDRQGVGRRKGQLGAPALAEVRKGRGHEEHPNNS